MWIAAVILVVVFTLPVAKCQVISHKDTKPETDVPRLSDMICYNSDLRSAQIVTRYQCCEASSAFFITSTSCPVVFCVYIFSSIYRYRSSITVHGMLISKTWCTWIFSIMHHLMIHACPTIHTSTLLMAWQQSGLLHRLFCCIAVNVNKPLDIYWNLRAARDPQSTDLHHSSHYVFCHFPQDF